MLSLSFLTQHLDLHALLEERKWLGEVHYAELVLRPQQSVLHSKVKPLLVPLGISVHLAVEAVLLDD